MTKEQTLSLEPFAHPIENNGSNSMGYGFWKKQVKSAGRHCIKESLKKNVKSNMKKSLSKKR